MVIRNDGHNANINIKYNCYITPTGVMVSFNTCPKVISRFKLNINKKDKIYKNEAKESFVLTNIDKYRVAAHQTKFHIIANILFIV